jgi:hypothetical protein
MDAIRKKALSAGILTNPVRITSIMQALGNSFKTDLQVDQIKTLFTIYNAIPDGKSSGLVLDTSTELGLLTSSSDTSAGYINYPILGFDKYANVQRWFHKNNPDPLLAREKPTITLANSGKATEKQLTDFAETLRDYGYTVTISKTYSSKNKSTSSELYSSKSSDKPIAGNYLASYLGLSIQKGSPLNSGSDFEIIYTPSTTAASVKASSSPSPSPSTTKTPTR